MKTHKGFPTFYAKSVEEWRQWLTDNHETEKNVWLIFYKKKSGKPSLDLGKAVDEALCFGWVDSKINGRDEESYYLYFSPRNPKSNWSRVNKEKITRLTAANKMTPAGLQMVAIAKETGTWNALDDVENLIVPDDLQAEFDKYPNAFKHWEAFPRSVKRSILEWILNGKRATTRAKRIQETATLAEKNERANQYKK